MLLEKYDHASVGSAPVELKYSEIATQLGGIDEKTVRRVIALWKDVAWSIKSVRGGIRVGADTYYERSTRANIELKDMVAERSAEIIEAGTSVAISPGSTCVESVGKLHRAGKHVQIVTNSHAIPDEVPDADVLLTGGKYLRAIHACIGNEAIACFRRASCRTALIGVSGIRADGALFVAHREEVDVLSEIVNSAQESILIAADVTKLARNDVWQFTSIQELLKARQDRKRTVILVTNSESRLKGASAAAARKTLTSLKNTKRFPGLVVEDDN
jgi:DeoR family glycerol-3-phosphate regulon repressor